MTDHGERTRQGMERARAAGAQIGKPVAPAFLPTYRRVLTMVDSGLSLTEVARQLNADNTPTARPGGRWHASTVRAIVVSQTAANL